MKQTQSSVGQHQKGTTGKTDRRKPGPKPKPKPWVECGDILMDRNFNYIDLTSVHDRCQNQKLADIDIVITVHVKASADSNNSHVRKAVRKTLQEYLTTPDERKEREKAKRHRQEADKIGLPVQNEGANPRTKEGAARRAKGDRRKRKG